MTRLSDLPEGWEVVVDTETSKLHPDDGGRVAVVSFAYWDPADESQMISQAVPFDQGVNPEYLPLGEKELDPATQRRLKKWPEWASREQIPNRPPEDFQQLLLLLSRCGLVFHNAKFDLTMLRAGLRGIPGRDLCTQFIWDTMLGQLVREPMMPKGLKSTAARLGLFPEGGEEDEAEALKPWLGPKSGKNQNPRYDLVPWSVMEPYARVDAELTLLLRRYQDVHLDPESDELLMRHIGREFQLSQVLLGMERRGVGFDAESCRAAAAQLRIELDAVAELLPFKGSTGRPTPNAARKFFFAASAEDEEMRPGTQDFRGIDPFPDKLTDGGQPQVDEEVVKRLAVLEIPFAAEYERHEGLKSALAKWYEPWPVACGEDGRLRTVHRQGGTVSGRLAVGRVQLQAIPHDYLMPSDNVPAIRKLFRPRDGHALLEFDVSQAEIRLATAIARCRPMLEGILRGDDSHSIACKLMFEIDEDHPEWEQLRQVAKRCNLGILYGAGARVIQEQLAKFTGAVYSLGKVRGWIADWKAAFPEFTQALSRAQRQAERHGFVRLHNGRERWFSDYEPSHKAFNQIVQGTLAEIMKDIMISVDEMFPEELLLQIHDSVLLETPVDEIDSRTAAVCQIMTEHFEKAVWAPWEPGGEPVRVPYRSDVKQW